MSSNVMSQSRQFVELFSFCNSSKRFRNRIDPTRFQIQPRRKMVKNSVNSEDFSDSGKVGKNAYTGGVESTRWQYNGNELEVNQLEIEEDDIGLKKIGVGAGLVQYLICRLPGMRRKKLPKIVSNAVDNLSIWALATCGFLWTSSTCMVFSLLPVFLHSELGFSNTRIGAVEGFALVVSNFSRVFSGVLSDMLKSRVKVIAVGSVMTAMMKLVLASALSVQWVVMAKLLDRFGKGIRAAPTDALIADLSPRPKRSSSYGLHQSMTTLGGVLGSIAAVVCMKLSQNNFRATFTAASVPSIFAIVILLSYVKNPQRAMKKPNYTPRPGRGRGLPSWRRHARGPLAMPHLRARWRRIECRDTSRDVAWHHRQRAWKNVREWLLQIQKRAVVVAPFLDQVVEGLDDGEFSPRSTVQLKRTPSGTMIKKVDREAQQHKDTQALGSEDLQERAYIWADDPWADEEKSRATSSGDRTKNVKKSSDMIVGWGEWSWSWSEAVQLPREFWRALFVFSILKVARFSEAFVTLHARAIGMQVAYLPILMFATNIVQSILTYPLGVIADKGDLNGASGRKFMLLGGFAVMVLADIVLVLAKVPWHVFVGYLIVGVHMSMTQGNMKAVLSATMPPNVRGTGFAISALSQGLALGLGNYMAGFLCDLLGSSGAFWGGMCWSILALGSGWLLL